MATARPRKMISASSPVEVQMALRSNDAGVAQEVERLAGLPHHAQIERCVQDDRLDGADAERAIAANGAYYGDLRLLVVKTSKCGWKENRSCTCFRDLSKRLDTRSGGA
jgi:hypothetical protein